MRSQFNICIIVVLFAGCFFGHQLAQAKSRQDVSYAVVVSRKTYANPPWKQVADTLKNKHAGTIVVYKESVAGALDKLKVIFPEYTCFVATPEEATRRYIADIHRMTRKLDTDPYTDVIWAVLTGYDASDALRIAKHQEPLVVKRCLSGTIGSPLDGYHQGRMYNELQKDVMWTKKAGKPVKQTTCPTDTTKMLVDDMNNYKPDVFITSGHATQRDWQIGFSYPNGYFRCQDGQLFGLDTRKKRHDINSPNPKVHLAIGNCLIGHIPDRNCMALALMHSGGVYQMLAYTVPSGYGFGGWGVKDYFSELQAGRFTLAQAHYANNQALVYMLEQRGENDDDPGKLGGGLRGDRDVVVLYGDPVWQVRMPTGKLPWTQSLSAKDGVYTFTILANEKGDWDNRPIVHLFDKRVTNISIVEGAQYNPVITDNFIMVQMRDELLPMKGNRGEKAAIRGDYEKGQKFTIRFKAQPCRD